MGRIVSLLGRELEPEVVNLLMLSIGHRMPEVSEEHTRALAREYAERETHALWGFEDDEGVLAGLTGIEWTPEGYLRVADLAVGESVRRRGTGRMLMEHLRFTLQPLGLGGFCLEAAVPFFEAVGIEVAPYGVMASGEPRFSLRWRPDRSA